MKCLTHCLIPVYYNARDATHRDSIRTLYSNERVVPQDSIDLFFSPPNSNFFCVFSIFLINFLESFSTLLTSFPSRTLRVPDLLFLLKILQRPELALQELLYFLPNLRLPLQSTAFVVVMERPKLFQAVERA